MRRVAKRGNASEDRTNKAQHMRERPVRIPEEIWRQHSPGEFHKKNRISFTFLSSSSSSKPLTGCGHMPSLLSCCKEPWCSGISLALQ